MDFHSAWLAARAADGVVAVRDTGVCVLALRDAEPCEHGRAAPVSHVSLLVYSGGDDPGPGPLSLSGPSAGRAGGSAGRRIVEHLSPLSGFFQFRRRRTQGWSTLPAGFQPGLGPGPAQAA